ncbi:MAG: nucleotide exchange factor GrpE [Arenimonas sp.]
MHTEPNNPGVDAPEAADLSGDAQLQLELEQLRIAMGNIRDEALRERAELDNQRKRLARDVDQARKFANERLLSELLPVLDSLEAGLQVSADETGKLREGMELTLRQLMKVASDNGMTPIHPIGEAFNPEWHQAISQIESPDAAPNTIVQVFQKGYLLNERLLRPALVVVAKHAD